jgi:hypothetical protein
VANLTPVSAGPLQKLQESKHLNFTELSQHFRFGCPHGEQVTGSTQTPDVQDVLNEFTFSRNVLKISETLNTCAARLLLRKDAEQGLIQEVDLAAACYRSQQPQVGEGVQML